MSGYPYNNNPHQPPNQNGASSSGYYQHPQGTQPPMHPSQQYYMQGQPNMQYQYNQAPFPMPVQVGIRPVFLPTMGFGQMGQGMVPPQAEMNMSLPHQQPQIDHSQQNMSMGQSDQMNNTFAGFGAQQPRRDRQNMRQQPPQRNGLRRQEARSRSHVTGRQNRNGRDGNGVQFSKDLYQQLRRQSPLDPNVIVDNNMMYNLLCGLTSDMVELQKSLEYVQGQLSQSQQSDQGSSNGEPSVQAPGPLDSTDHENISEDSGNGETQTTKMNGDGAPKRSKAAPGVQQITTESNELVGNTNIPKESSSEETARRKMINEHVSTVEHAKVTSTDNVTPTTPTKQENFTKAQYSDVAQIAFASSQPTSSSQPIIRRTTRTTAPPKRTAENMPVKRTDPIAPPKPITSKPVSQAVEKPTDGFEFPRAKNVAPARSTSTPPAMSHEVFMDALAERKNYKEKADKPLPMALEKKETPPSTPSKKKKETSKAGSSNKKTPNPSPAPKDQNQEDGEFKIQEELYVFEKDMKKKLNLYISIVSHNSGPTAQSSYLPFFNKITEYLKKKVPFDKEKVSRYLASRIESHTTKTDLKSQKMRVLLTLIAESTNEIIRMDSMFLFANSASRKDRESNEDSYLGMIMESKEWLKDGIIHYGEMIERSRLWNAAFVKNRPDKHPLQIQIDSFLSEVDRFNQTLKDKAAGIMETRIAFLGNITDEAAENAKILYTLMSGIDKTPILDDILFLFSEDREILEQTTLEFHYYNMVVDSCNWLTKEEYESPLIRTDFDAFPVKLAKNHLDGFIEHITGQYIIRNKLDDWQEELKGMKQAEEHVYNAFEASEGRAKSLSTKECRLYLEERKKKLEEISPPSEQTKLFIRFYEFLIQVDSSIINFDTSYFKNCLDAPESVDPSHAMTDDEQFFVQIFRMQRF